MGDSNGIARSSIQDLMDTVPIKNRVVDGMVCITFDRQQIVWQPGEVKGMPRKVAEWFIRKSMYSFQPGDESRGIKAKAHYTLCIVGDGKDESELTDEQRRRPELIDRSGMQPYDLKTGKPMRVVYIDPNQVAGVNELNAKAYAQDKVQERAVEAVSEKIVQVAANEAGDIADKVLDESGNLRAEE